MNITKSDKDKLANKALLSISILSGLLVVIIAAVLLNESYGFLADESLLKTIFGTTWNFSKNLYGLRPYIAGSLMVTGIAILFGGLPAVFVAIYLSEYASTRIRKTIKPFVDLLASIPSVVFGLWGVMIIVPFVRRHLAPLLGFYSSGYSLISAGLVLGLMITPIIISITDEVLQSVPQKYSRASLALGATKWQTIKTNIENSALPGIVGGVILGFGRAIGETIAMTMLSGGGGVPNSLWDSFSTLTTLINNKLGYSQSNPKAVSALATAGLILLAIVLLTNIAGRIIVNRTMEGER